MNSNDYVKLKERAKEAGLEDHPSLIQLLQDHYRAYMRDMNEWEKNCARSVEEAIRKRSYGDSKR